MPDFHGTLSATRSGAKAASAACCCRRARGTAVELRTEHGGVFLRKLAPSVTAARNEAEYLRLLLHHESHHAAAVGAQAFCA